MNKIIVLSFVFSTLSCTNLENNKKLTKKDELVFLYSLFLKK